MNNIIGLIIALSIIILIIAVLVTNKEKKHVHILLIVDYYIAISKEEKKQLEDRKETLPICYIITYLYNMEERTVKAYNKKGIGLKATLKLLGQRTIENEIY